MTQRETFFLPGPTEVRPEVLAAMQRPMISHRGREFEALFARTQVGLRAVFGTERPVYVSTSSATGLMEAAIRNAPVGPVLALVNGGFSGKFAKIAELCGREVDRLEIPWGGVFDFTEVKHRLHGGHASGAYAAVTVVHSETSTGVLTDVSAVARLAREVGAACLVDSVTGAGGAELRADEWGLDFVLTGSQKAFALPPGLSFGVASAPFIAGAEAVPGRGTYFDLVEFEKFAAKHQTPTTPAVSLMYALDVQMRDMQDVGMPARWARHREMSEETARWVSAAAGRLGRAGKGLRVLAPEGHRSPTVTAVCTPEGVSGPALVRALADRGFVIGGGYGLVKETTVRIGHMGDHTVEGLQGCLEACEDALTELVAKPG